MNDVNVQEVINRLALRISELTVENAILKSQLARFENETPPTE